MHWCSFGGRAPASSSMSRVWRRQVAHVVFSPFANFFSTGWLAHVLLLELLPWLEISKASCRDLP
jgi:hypothetical protein